MSIVLVCRPNNDLHRILVENGISLRRCDTVAEAMGGAGEDDAVLILADGYPDQATQLSAEFPAQAEGVGRVYVEFAEGLPGIDAAEICQPTWERLGVASDVFGPELCEGRILMAHGCQYLRVPPRPAQLVSARIAGFDTAVYGLPESSAPILFEASSRLLVATTSLSHFRTARFAPSEAWRAVWRWILHWLSPELDLSCFSWQPSVAPSAGPDGASPAEDEAIARGAGWYERARLFVHPDWAGRVKTGVNGLPTGIAPGPGDDWPAGDGSLGMIEGANSSIHPDGSQNWVFDLRNDCMGEASMALALAGRLQDQPRWRELAANVNDFIYSCPAFSGGPRAEPESASYGLVAWTGNDASNGVYYGDDNARAMLGTIACATALGEPRWNERVFRCLLANLRTTGPSGFRGNRLEDATLQGKGWRYYWETDRQNLAPHYESWLWACFLWAYRQTGYEPFRERASRAIGLTMAGYPDQWRWTNGMQQERARMLLPLAWLVRVDDTAEHRAWLRQVTTDLLAFQDSCGAIREEVGGAGKGAYGPPPTNEAYGTSEAPLIQANGDSLCDLLYTTNFAFVGLHEAAAATGDADLREAADRLAAFLCRIQVHSPEHPQLDGGWFRAFDFGRWDYWASNADLGWGAWSIESGWTQGWIAAILALRQMGTSYWDFTADCRLADGCVARLVDEMFGNGS